MRSCMDGLNRLVGAWAGPKGVNGMPSPGGLVSGIAGPCHPDDLPEGYHTAARGQQLRMVGPPVCVEGLPTNDRAVGLRQVDGMALGTQPRCGQGAGSGSFCGGSWPSGPSLGVRNHPIATTVRLTDGRGSCESAPLRPV